MRLASLSFMALSLAAIMAGCSSNTDVGGTGGTGIAPAPYKPGGNGKAINEPDACKIMFDAITAQGVKLGCTLTMATCPGYIQSSAPKEPHCMLWDEGTILGCKSFIGTYTSCSDFENRPCIISYIPNSAPNGCPADAGTDAAVSEGGTDAQAQEDVVVPDDATTPDDATSPEDAAVEASASQDAAAD